MVQKGSCNICYPPPPKIVVCCDACVGHVGTHHVAAAEHHGVQQQPAAVGVGAQEVLQGQSTAAGCRRRYGCYSLRGGGTGHARLCKMRGRELH